MAKFYGTIVKTGRVGGSVFAVNHGTTIERQYQPVVANPKSNAQVEARAKLKLISQVSAVLAPYAVFTREGLVSPRNKFVTANYGALVFSNMKADVNLIGVKLTPGVIALPPITATLSAAVITANLANSVSGLEKVVYIAVLRQPDSAIRVVATSVVSDAGSAGNYATTLPVGTNQSVVMYAYGIRALTERARIDLSNMTVSAEYLASVIATRIVTQGDIATTETKSIQVSAE